MSLTAKKKHDEFLTAIKMEDQLQDDPVPEPTAQAGINNTNNSSGTNNNNKSSVKQHIAGATVHVEEKISLAMERDGGVIKMDVSGQLKLTVFDPDNCRIIIDSTGPLPANGTDAFKCQLRPGVDKNAWLSEGSLVLSDKGKGFALGTENAAILLRWRRNLKGEEAIPPFTLNFWPNTENGYSIVSAEYTVEQGKGAIPVRDVVVTIPCPSPVPPTVAKIDGNFRFDKQSKQLYWMIPEISEEHGAGTFEFKIPEVDGESFFPINIDFSSTTLTSGLEIKGVRRIEDNSPVEFIQHVLLTTDKFVIE